MPRTTFQVKGLRELEQKLRTLSPRLMRKVARAALRAGGTLVVRAARKRVRKKSGLLKRSIGQKSLRLRPRSAAVLVGPRAPAFHGHLIEFGTSRSRAFPFMRPALNETKKAVVAIIAAKASAGIKKEAARR